MNNINYEKYTKELFELVEVKANVAEFKDLYYTYFKRDPPYSLEQSYLSKINDAPDYNISYDSYTESYD